MNTRRTNARPTKNPLVAGCLLAISLLACGIAPAEADPPTDPLGWCNQALLGCLVEGRG